jgi:mono/diheme cytochrome c family protein
MRSRIICTTVASGVVLIGIGMMHFSLTALQEPGPLETRIANLGKHSVIRLASRREVPPRPLDTEASIEAGSEHYGLDCGICHGVDGRAQTPSGQWMYPRAADLTSKQVQNYSDQELFWIIRNGIRFTGMPAFGKVETADNIWSLVKYVRTLPSTNMSGPGKIDSFRNRHTATPGKGESRWTSVEIQTATAGTQPRFH